MDLSQLAVLCIVALIAALLLFLELGRRIGRHQLARGQGGLARGAGTAEGAVFGLLGLLIAFTFSGAAERFEQRRHLTTEEANAIGTAYLRLELLASQDQMTLRPLFRDYTKLRAQVYSEAQDFSLTLQRLAASQQLQSRIWTLAVTASQHAGAAPQSAMLLLPALNEMFDITTTQHMATQNHPPAVVFLLLLVLSLIGSLLIGYEMAANRARSWLHHVAFATIMALAMYVIVDLEFPRLGLIRVNNADLVLKELQQSM